MQLNYLWNQIMQIMQILEPNYATKVFLEPNYANYANFGTKLCKCET
jgi:hypothetical protein